MSSVADQITKLAGLHSAGGVTDSEFQTAKQRILGLARPGGGPVAIVPFGPSQTTLSIEIAPTARTLPTATSPLLSVAGATTTSQIIGLLHHIAICVAADPPDRRRRTPQLSRPPFLEPQRPWTANNKS